MTQPSRSSEAFLGRAVGWVMAGSGFAGLAAAFALTIDKFRLLEDPGYVPSCTIDTVLACGTIMQSDQSEAFGFPNPLIGLAGFAALLALGVVVSAGVQLPRGIWIAIQAGLTFAVVFVHWLFVQSLYEIGALCPYCMVVWVATIVAFVYVTLRNLASGVFRLPGVLMRASSVGIRYHGVVVVAWLGILTVLVGEAFWDHWRTVI